MLQNGKPHLVVLISVTTFFITAGLLAGKDAQVLKVTATAYNSLPGQTQNDPTLTAWGENLVPGMDLPVHKFVNNPQKQINKKIQCQFLISD